MPADFLIIGAMKCATSTVSAFLEDHPEVFMVAGKEPNYFCFDSNFTKGSEWYEELFTNRADEKICGEGSNYYSARALYPKCAERMAAYNPNLKVIYIVRHPLTRIVSAWVQNRADSGDMVPPSPDEAVRQMPDRFVGQSLYWHNLEPYRALFPETQIFIGFLEDLNRDPDAFFGRLCRFLEVKPRPAQRSHQNQSAGKRVPTRAYTALERLPMIGAVKSVVPRQLKNAVKSRILSREVKEPPVFSPSVHADLIAEIKPDAEAFLAYCGKPLDFWRLDPSLDRASK